MLYYKSGIANYSGIPKQWYSPPTYDTGNTLIIFQKKKPSPYKQKENTNSPASALLMSLLLLELFFPRSLDPVNKTKRCAHFTIIKYSDITNVRFFEAHCLTESVFPYPSTLACMQQMSMIACL